MPLTWGRRQPTTPERVREGLPLAPNEERYVLTAATLPEVYGNPWTLRIRGPLDVRRFEAAVVWCCQRHEARRTGYELSSDGRYTRYVEAEARAKVTLLSIPGADGDQLRAAIEDWYFHQVDLTPATLGRYILIRVGRDEHVFGYAFHHSTNDGESKDTFLEEVLARYSGREDFPPVRQYSDVWAWDWEASEPYLAAKAYWIEKLRGLDDIGTLPEDRPPPTDREPPGCTVDLRLPPELAGLAREAAKRVGVSEFTFYYAVSLICLSRLTGQPRVGSTFQSAGRRSVPDSEGVHGCFSNGLILATAVNEAESVSELAQRLRVEIREALANEACPYHHVIRASRVSPRFGINWFPKVPVSTAPGLEISRPYMAYGRYEYDLNLRFIRDDTDGGIDLVIFHRKGVYGRDRVAAIGEHFARLLEAFSREPDAPIGSIRSTAVAAPGALPDPDAPLPGGAGELIYARFLDHAARTPDAVAVLFEDERLTYGDLERRSRNLAAGLSGLGVAPGDRVAILAERGPALVWSMLAAARLGAVFVVLDSAYPERRLESLLEISVAKVLVQAGGEALAGAVRRLARRRGLPVLDANAGDAAASAAVPGLDRGDPAQPAYYLFTSGSTGRPKCVACSHAPLSHFVDWQARTYGLEAGDRFTLLSGLSHDPVLRDVFTPLSLGASLAIPWQDEITEPGALAGWLRRRGATVAHVTPALGQLIAAGANPVLPALRRLFWGGDRLPPALVREVSRLAPACRQVNFYGCTETPQAVAAFDCDEDLTRASVPIGRGSEGNQLLVVDARGAPVGPGEVGEIAVRSVYPSLGYVDGETIAPFETRVGGHGLYFTGDRGFYLPGGTVLMLGRADDQVKVRGHRVELSEIATALNAHPGVRAAIALPVGEGARLRLVAFVVVSRRRPPTAGDLATHLAGRLPAYMLPHAIRVLEALPLLANGKVDREALRAMAGAEPAEAAPPAGAATGREQALIAAWQGVLGEPGISRDSSFASSGGDSLSYVQVYLATEAVIGVVPSGWQVKSIAELALSDRAVSRFWSVVDTPMVIRATSIFLVVVGHMHLFRYGGGATTGLLVVSGYLFGGLQLREVFSRGSAEPILKGLRKLLLPVMLFSAALFAAKALAGKDPNLSVLFLYGDFQDYSRLVGPHYGGHEFYLWFIHCLLQMIALLYLAVFALGRLRGFGVGQVRFTLGLFLLACLTRFVAPAFFIPGFLSHGARHLSTVGFLPTTHLATFLLGALIAEAESRRQKAWVFALLVAYGAATAQVFGWHQAAVVLAGGVLILFVKRFALPRPLTFGVLLLSGASLFIYLTQFIPRSVLHALGAPGWPALDAAAGLVLGVFTWWAWTWVSVLWARRMNQTAVAEPQAAI